MTEYTINPGLKEYASEKQKGWIDAINAAGSFRGGARLLGIKSHDMVRVSIRALEITAAARGYNPKAKHQFPICAPFVAKGYSTLRDMRTGEEVMQWEKTKVDDQLRAQAILAAFESAALPLPRLSITPRPSETKPKLLNLYTFTDYHLGMRAWGAEAGKDWDLKSAEAMLVEAFQYMISNSPPARVGFINQLGDFFHSDSLLPVTPTSGHIVDQGATYAEMVETGVRVLRRLVDMALVHHEQVVVLMAEGNHDLASSVWLRTMFKALYENEPRVVVVDSGHPFYSYMHGQTMLGFHHGHKVKNEALPLLFASKFRELWGRAKKVYIHCGHRHHVDEKEHNGAKVIQHPTLAGADGYAARNGYESESEASVITYHEDFGQAGRTTVTPEMLAHA